MPETIHTAGQGHAQLQLNTHITPAFIARLDVELQQLLHGRFKALRQRMMPAKTAARLTTIVKYLSIAGLCLCVLLFALGGLLFHGIRLEVAFAVFFLIMLVLHWDKNKRIAKNEKFFGPYWNWLARNSTNRMLKVAKAAAPFNAEYHFQGNIASYYRVGSAGKVLAWKREMRHFYLPGQHVSLLFKKQTSIYPYAIILHEQAQELAAYLERLGVVRIG
ncbi:hypothetical protein [Undibacterium pigrum]|uniref:YcxB-like protein n=1 Tax=Undibacterium pigrum TaxID=401470 RepID=A0A318J229_9BURK|nr:hypothetical protein [Undibacterium pigrum]PXX41454.1 hypothetical protein DFR42_107105 [Undibacterium pigrum]